jgi:hypothetical protein
MPNVAELIPEQVTVTVDCVDRIYLNGSVPRLQGEGNGVGFGVHGRGQVIPWVEFHKGEWKDTVIERDRARFRRTQGALGHGAP